MKSRGFKRAAAGILAVLCAASYLPALSASADVPDFGAVTAMPSAPFGTAGASAPYFAKPCNERLATLPEALMKLTDDGYTWSGAYGADKPEWALTLMDYANIYSYIHTHEIDADTLRAVLADGDSMLHKKPFTAEEIELLLGDDEAAAMAAFASPSTIVIGEKGYCAKWMYAHTVEEYAEAGITPEMVAAVLPYYYNPLFVQEAADAFSQKLSQYAGQLGATKWHQWKAGDINLDSVINDDDTALLSAFLSDEAALTFTQWASADLDGNSDVDAADLTALQEKVAAGITESGVMLDVIEFCQYPDYPTGCESVSLYMLLNYYGVDVTVDNIYDLLPMGAQPYDDENGVRHGANPEREFVGDPRSEYSYGVFNDPIAGVAEQLKPGVQTERGVTIDRIKEILDTGNPVLAWYVSAPMRDIMYRWTWLDEQGELVSWPGGEHAVVVCGYDDDSITYRDPNAGTTVCIDYATFEKSFNELGGRIVYYTEAPAERFSYVNADGESVKKPAVRLTGSETALESGWYAADGDVTIDSAVTVKGDVNLILTDGAKLTVNGEISGNAYLTVYGQTAGTGELDGTEITAVGYTQYGGRTVLKSTRKDALIASETVDLRGGQFETNAGIYSTRVFTMGYTKDTDYIRAAAYHGSRYTVTDGQALYVPDLPKDFSRISFETPVSLFYNGKEQTPAKEDLLGTLIFDTPLYTGTAFLSDANMEVAANRRICPYTGEYTPKQYMISELLTADDFEIGAVDPCKDVKPAGSEDRTYIEIIGKGEYTGTAKVEWYIKPAIVSDDITVTPKSPIIYDGSAVTPDDFEIKASTPLAQELVDMIAAGKAQAPIGTYNPAPLTGENISSECVADIALEKGHVYDLHDLGMYLALMIENGVGENPITTLTNGALDTTVWIMKDGERMNGCVEIDEEGALCYYELRNGVEHYVKGTPNPGMYWCIQKSSGDGGSFPIYYMKQDFMEVQRTEAVEPGDYVARMIISETESENYTYVTKIIPFTIKEKPAEEEPEQIAPDETLLKWAEKDYQSKTGTAVTAVPVEKQDGTLAIALKDSTGNNVMSYEIDTATGIGTDSDGAEVNLPQTGNNSLTNWLLVAAAWLMMLAGGFAVHTSGIFRRRKDTE